VSGVGAVVTTGIYCRDDCPARPNPANVIAYAYTAAAEKAGFRACHRCRPYRAELQVAAGSPELVCRGMQLVADGALDNATEARLAQRLGVSVRHLRRLFTQHIGVTPSQLASSRRAHFARRLLDDTDLQIADIAFAAGFGSIRQFNRVLAEVFRTTPAELRRRRRSSDRLQADGGLAIRLAHSGDLDFAAMLRFLADRAIPAVESVTPTAYRRIIVEDGDPGVIEITQRSPADLVLVAHLPRLGGLLHQVRRARQIFGLDDPAHQPGSWDPFEAGAHSIITSGTQSPPDAMTILGEIASQWGRPVPGLGPLGLSTTFPTPADLARSDLGDLPIPARTKHHLHTFAQAITSGVIRLDHSWPPAKISQTVRDCGLPPALAHDLTRQTSNGPQPTDPAAR
jgi:AraC family transcriptional regulator of adaptative response / DNA-3-methyladenine glycosylase II